MKYYLLFFFTVPVIFSIAQDTTFYNNENKKVKSRKKAFYTRVISYSEDSTKATVADSYLNGKLKSKRTIKKRSAGYKIETFTHYYENGNPEYFYTRVNERLEGNSLFYDENGTLSMLFQYENGEVKQRKFFDKEGKQFSEQDTKVYLLAETMPEFPGGTKALVSYIASHIKYPSESYELNSGGRVIIGFVINERGEVSNIELIKGVDFHIDNEAMRVVKNMPKWNPGMIDGKPVSVKFTIPIAFQPHVK